MMRNSLTLVLAVLMLPTLCRAVPTGLNTMPTAEVLSLGDVRVDFESAGSGKLYVPPNGTLTGTQTGLILGVEGGIDSVTDRDTVYNLKWRFKGEGLIIPALAAGAQNLTSGEKPQYYLVGTKSLLPLGGAKVHAGLMRDENGETLTMVGAGARLGPVAVKADNVQGGNKDRSSVSAGITLQSLSVIGTIYDIDGQDERTIMVSYSHRFL